MVPATSSARLDEGRERGSSGVGSYGRIIESSALIGAATLASVAVGIVRAKAMAMLLGPAGFGLMGTFQAVADLARSIAEVGINSSGVRQIAEAASSGDTSRVARTAAVLRRVAVVLGLLGAAMLVALAVPVSLVTFGSAEHATAIALLSLAVFLKLISDAQGALIQGMRRIADLARASVLAAVAGTVFAVALVWWLRADGVVPALVAIAAASLACTWWYSREAWATAPRLRAAEMRSETRSLLHLGLAFMASSLLMAGAAYAARVIVGREVGLEAVGLYQAAWTVGGLYVGFVLQAMGADFYPRLVGAIDDPRQCRQLVNEQAHASILLAAPGVIATLAIAPVVLSLFYSPEFSPAAETLRWLCLGLSMRVATWPMGYIIVAKGARNVFVLTELAWAAFNVASTWLLVRQFGLPGIGLAFFISYLFHYAIIYPIVRRMVGFRWTSRSAFAISSVLALCIALLVATYLLPEGIVLASGLLFAFASAWYAARALAPFLPQDRIPPLVRRLLQTK